MSGLPSGRKRLPSSAWLLAAAGLSIPVACRGRGVHALARSTPHGV